MFQPGAVLNTVGFGNRAETIEVPHIDVRNPSEQDVNYDIGKPWVNRLGLRQFTLMSKTSFNGVTTANWVELTTEIGDLKTINSVAADVLGNINLASTNGSLTVTPVPLSNRIDFTVGVPPDFLWNVITDSTPVLMLPSNGYIVNNIVDESIFLLPDNPVIGDKYLITGTQNFNWSVIPPFTGTAWTIRLGTVTIDSEVTLTNRMTSITGYECCEIIYVGNQTFNIVSNIGNFEFIGV